MTSTQGWILLVLACLFWLISHGYKVRLRAMSRDRDALEDVLNAATPILGASTSSSDLAVQLRANAAAPVITAALNKRPTPRPESLR